MTNRSPKGKTIEKSFKALWEERRRKLREQEFGMIFYGIEGDSYENILELGSGDGCQSDALMNYGKNVVATEYNKEKMFESEKGEKGCYRCIADAENLPFEDNCYDLIYSSSLLEHIEDIGGCMKELYRVLKYDGLMIHSMPNRLWKVVNVLLYYPFILYALSNKERRREIMKKMIEDRHRNNIKRDNIKISKRLLPTIHGISSNHLDEFVRFGQKRWISEFEKYGFKITATKNLSISSSYRFGLTKVRNILILCGLTTSYAYFIRKQ